MSDVFPGDVPLNHSDAWLSSTVANLGAVDRLDAARRVYLDKDCEVFALVSPEDYEWVTQWRWAWKWDRTKTKRYAYRTSWEGGRRVSVYMHKAILNHAGKVQPSEDHTIGDHQDGESLNNQRDNLEWATVSQNRRSRKR